MNKRGFTLIELLGVLVILSVLSLITVPIIDRSLNTGRDNLSKTQEEQLKKALKDYYSSTTELRREINKMNDGQKECKSLNELKSAGFLPADIKNPKTNEAYDDLSVKVCVTKAVYNDTYRLSYSVEY